MVKGVADRQRSKRGRPGEREATFYMRLASEPRDKQTYEYTGGLEVIFFAADWQGGVRRSGPTCRRGVLELGWRTDGRVVGRLLVPAG